MEGGRGDIFFNEGFLHPRDTYLSDHGREEEEEEQRFRGGRGGVKKKYNKGAKGGMKGQIIYTLSWKGGVKTLQLCMHIYV